MDEKTRTGDGAVTFGWILLLLAGFEFKHFVADYLLQSGWMIGGKGELTALGGYVHAGTHALASAIVLAIARVPVLALFGIVAAEFVVHYAFDFAKAHYGEGVDPDQQPQRFWALHGFDQLLHQLTYVLMTWLALKSIAAI